MGRATRPPPRRLTPDLANSFLHTKAVNVDHIERVIYTGYKVTVTGSVPVQTTSGQTRLQFRITGEIDKAAVRRNAQRKIAETRIAKRAGIGGAPMIGPSYGAEPLGS